MTVVSVSGSVIAAAPVVDVAAAVALAVAAGSRSALILCGNQTTSDLVFVPNAPSASISTDEDSGDSV